MAMLLYRTRQFWWALTAAPTEDDLAQARRTLSPALMALFQRMQPGEQAHSLAVLNEIIRRGETDLDLWAAALLHDVGKSCHPLRLWDRVVIVVVQTVLPGKAGAWGEVEPAGWRRALVVASKHPEWGAQLVAQAGGSEAVVELIRHHQDRAYAGSDNRIARLLRQLQQVDHEM